MFWLCNAYFAAFFLAFFAAFGAVLPPLLSPEEKATVWPNV
jgi:hypothetical protein